MWSKVIAPAASSLCEMQYIQETNSDVKQRPWEFMNLTIESHRSLVKPNLRSPFCAIRERRTFQFKISNQDFKVTSTHSVSENEALDYSRMSRTDLRKAIVIAKLDTQPFGTEIDRSDSAWRWRNASAMGGNGSTDQVAYMPTNFAIRLILVQYVRRSSLHPQTAQIALLHSPSLLILSRYYVIVVKKAVKI